MRQLILVAMVIVAASCSSGGGGTPQSVVQPGHGAITVEIIPNPIVAQHVSGDTYSFPFDVVVRETGRHAVSISRVTADVNALGSIHVATESYDAAQIRALGYATTVPSNGTLRYHFAPQKSVPDERLFGGVSAELLVDAVDDTGAPITASTTMTVRR